MRVPVKLVMTHAKDLLKVEGDTSIREAACVMKAKQVGSLLVTKGGECVGIITDTDITRRVVAERREAEGTTVDMVMSAPVPTIDQESSLLDANDLMARHRVRHLGVTQEGTIVGLISVSDLVRFLTNYPRE